MPHPDSFRARALLTVDGQPHEIWSLARLEDSGVPVSHLPYTLRILLENLLRREDGVAVRPDDVAALTAWTPGERPAGEIAFMPARVLLQDFTGVPALVDLAALRDAVAALGGDPARVNPMLPAELVIDHSVQVDAWASPEAPRRNTALDYARNGERYAFLRWAQQAFADLVVVPPSTGIVHQVNLEYLARVVFVRPQPDGPPQAYPDTLVGTDSHTPMINGLGVLGWGVGGIEAEAAMLGQPVGLPVPEVVGVRVQGALPPGATATDLVLTVTELLRRTGVVGRFVEFFGDGLAHLGAADRATIANMTPEFGATAAVFPVDDETLAYLRLTNRPPAHVRLVEAYMKAQGLFRTEDTPAPRFTRTLSLDLSTIEPSVAGPRRPQDRVPLPRVAAGFREALPSLLPAAPPAADAGSSDEPGHGSVVIAAITSCTNTSNPSVMLAAGLLARRAAARGLRPPAWVKTSLAPGSRVVTRYLERTGLQRDLDALGFHLVGYGCTTCIGNSGPLPDEVSQAVEQRGLVVCAVLSGNRNFEGRIHPQVRANYLMSPPLVVAYALAGSMDVDLVHEPLARDRDGTLVYLRDLWPAPEEIARAVADGVRGEMFAEVYADVYRGDATWQALPVPAGGAYHWDPSSTYVRRPPYFDGIRAEGVPPVADITGARALVVLGDSVTTDHISPAGSIHPDSPAGRFLRTAGVAPGDFNSYGARRGNHEVMVRGTFASGRLRNRLADREGGVTTHLPSGTRMTIYDAAMRYRAEGVPLVVVAGREYGSGSSRDWAAKGPALLGVRAVLAEGFERIHRSNLVGMGILPLQLQPGDGVGTLTGHETFDIAGIAHALAGPRTVRLVATGPEGQRRELEAVVRVDTPQEAEYYRHGGILPYVLRHLLAGDGVEPVGAGVATGSRAPSDARVEDASALSFPASDPPTY